jgi:cytochrome c553
VLQYYNTFVPPIGRTLLDDNNLPANLEVPTMLGSLSSPFRVCLLLSPLILLGLLAPVDVNAEPAKAASSPDFIKDVRPLLADRCFNCHGPDEKSRKAGLRLDVREAALAPADSGVAAIVPGDPSKSELIARVKSHMNSKVMPPPRIGKKLSDTEVAILENWIKQGAKYAAHWAYIPVVRPAVPSIVNAGNPIDAFVLERLAKLKLTPVEQADKVALLRRVALDLTGVPPTIEQADAFLADSRPDAYERLVDRLLASPAFGEKWAVSWLDLARYADSQGFANDPDRTIWPWRDWVVRSLNANMPFDQFTIEQLAGDLLPGATVEQKIATGFHRNTLTNTEGGTNPEEFRSAAVVDRVNTTLGVWMAATMACAQCHNHKYDPFSQKEYFQLYAIFNNSQDANGGDDAPNINFILPGREADHKAATERLAQARKELASEQANLDKELPNWEKTGDKGRVTPELAAILKIEPAKRTAPQKKQLETFHRKQSATWTKLDAEIRTLEAKIKTLSANSPILHELPKGRVTKIHVRGDFQDLGTEVSPGLPAVFGDSTKPGEKMDRLKLARWLVEERNPLTARVAVNRLWEELFGVGIVETSEDFGTQGDQPSNQALLDWLASEYVRGASAPPEAVGWDTKRMLRLMVTSDAYRRSSRVTEDALRVDPNNRFLARGPRVRLSAESIRDQALFIGGLMSRKMGGPPVQPPKPNLGLSAAFGSSTDWVDATGEDRFRRGLYTRWRRNAPYPSFTTFDAPERTFCSIRRIRTNTPLQALVTLNDPVFVEAAQGLARRILTEKQGSVADRVEFAFRLTLTRKPTAKESERLVALYEAVKQKYTAQDGQAKQLTTQPLAPLPEGTNVVEAAAWVVISNVILNLDETLAKR